jgi:hypothetical protein
MSQMKRDYERSERDRAAEELDDDRPMSLTEYASIESGFPIGSQQLTNYINRYYGHG